MLVVLLDDAAALALLFLVLWFFKIKLPLAGVIIFGLLAGTVVFIVHKAIIPSLHKKKFTGPEAMVGKKGRVTEPLKPVGTVRVGNEYWQARSIGDNIAVGEEIEIVGLDRLTLRVKRKGG